ncbi:MAG: DNA polymerase III subunit gamma/tau [Gemmatimonadetes bacterium]|nr:DNA polymerase III subunit gamma/tau [Gemmatimonadota bacterium]
MATALARKYRPRRFADVAVQTHVANTLRNAVEHDRVAHAYLLCGPRGTGKTTLARVLAMSLNCEQRRKDREPCGTCSSCERIWGGAASLDVVEIDAASNRGVDDARELRERAMYAPTGDDRYKVYIIDEAHMLTKEAWNALLKIIEEPPPRVVFVFATTEPQRIANQAAPILSRVQRFDLRRMGPADVRTRLAAVLESEKVKAEPDALGMLSRAADGSMRDCLSLTDQVLAMSGGTVTAAAVRDTLGLVHDDEVLGLLDLIAGHRASEVFSTIARLSDAGIDLGLLLAAIGDALRAELAITLGGDAADVSEGMRASLAASRGRFGAPDLLRMLNLVVEIEPHFRRSAQQRLLLETLLVRLALLDRTVALEDVLRGLPGAGEAPIARTPTRASAVSEASAPKASMQAAPATPARPAKPQPTVVADSPVAAATAAPKVPLDSNRLAERWESIIDAVRAAGRGIVASSLAEAKAADAKDGVVTVRVDSDALETAISKGSEAVLAALQASFTGVTRVAIQRIEAAAPQKRMTEGDIMAAKVATLRKGAPLLDAAFESLDLRLVE